MITFKDFINEENMFGDIGNITTDSDTWRYILLLSNGKVEYGIFHDIGDPVEYVSRFIFNHSEINGNDHVMWAWEKGYENHIRKMVNNVLTNNSKNECMKDADDGMYWLPRAFLFKPNTHLSSILGRTMIKYGIEGVEKFAKDLKLYELNTEFENT